MQSLPKRGLSLVWGSLRNVLDFPNVIIPDEVRLVNTVPGYFPIGAHLKVPLEIPKGGQRMDLSGRFNSASSSLWEDVFRDAPYRARIVQLPLYTYNSNMSFDEAMQKFSSMLKFWNETLIPDSVPCAGLALRVEGGYCLERNAESVFVLLVWPNQVARILELEWFEGPLEDCISPEWYVKSSLSLPLHVAMEAASTFIKTLPDWISPRMSLSPKPAFLGYRLQKGNRRKEFSGGWLCEWEYRSETDFVEDACQILEDMNCMFTGVTDQEAIQETKIHIIE